MEYTTILLNSWTRFSFKSTKLIYIFIILEISTIWIESFNCISSLLNYYSFIPIDKKNEGLTQLNKLSPISYLKQTTLSKVTSQTDCSTEACTQSFQFIFLTSSVAAFIIFIQHFYSYIEYKQFLSTNNAYLFDNNYKINRTVAIMKSIFIIFVEIVLRICGIFIMHIFLNKLLVGIYFKYEIVLSLYSGVFLACYILSYLYQISFINLLVRFDFHDKLQYDNFSTFYDYHLLIIKFCIALAENLNTINENNQFSFHIAFFNLSTIILIFHFCLKSIFNVIYNKRLNIINNMKFNLFRLFLMIVVCAYIFCYIIYNFFSVFDIVLTSVTSLIFSTSIIIWVKRKISSIIYKDEKVIYQLMYLLDHYMTCENDNVNFEKEVLKFNLFHNLECSKKFKNKNCNICALEELMNLQDSNENIQLKFISAMFTLIENKLLKTYTAEEIELFNILSLIFNYNLTVLDSTIPHFKIVYKTKDLLRNYEKKRNCYYYNLALYFFKINRHTEKNLRKFKTIQTFDLCVNSLKKSIDIIMEFIITINARIKKDLYPILSQMNSHKVNIINCLTQLNSQRNVEMDQFTFLICKFVFEKIYNLDLNSFHKNLNDLDDFESRLDMIEERYKNDCILIIKYSVQANNLLITKATKNFKDFQGKNFESIFLNILREEGKARFIEQINTNNDSFTFEFVIETLQNYIKDVKLHCKIFRAFNLQEIFILATYETSQEDLIVFETSSFLDNSKSNLKIYDLDNNKLIAFSEDLAKMLFLTPKIINFIRTIRKCNISFNNVFEQPSSHSNLKSTSMILNPYNYDYLLIYSHYYFKIFKRFEDSPQYMDNEELFEKIREMKSLAYANIVVNVKVVLKYTIKYSDDMDICVYTLKATYKKRNSLIDSSSAHVSLLNYIKDHEPKEEKANFNHYQKELQNDNNNSSASQLASGKNMILPIFVNKKNVSFNSENNLNKFSYLTLIVNSLMVLYCVVFLILGYTSNNTITELNTLKILYNSFQRIFFQTTVNLFHNSMILDKGKFEFSEIIDPYFDFGLSINLGSYTAQELNVKFDMLKKNLNELQNFIYTSSFVEELNVIFNSNINISILSLHENGFSVSQMYKSFFDAIIIYMNNGKSIIFDFNFPYAPINIFNFNFKSTLFDFSSLTNQNINTQQKLIYESTMNMPIYFNTFNKISAEIDNLSNHATSKLFNINNWLSIIFIALHFILCFICMAIFKSLKKTIDDSNFIIFKLSSGDWTKYLYKKMEIIKEIIQFYKSDPIGNSNTLKQLIRENRYKTLKYNNKNRKSRNKVTDLEQDDAELFQKSMISQNESQINFQTLISPLVTALLILFSVYFLYACCFVIFFQIVYNNLNVTSLFLSNFLKIEVSIDNSIILLQTIMFSNQTDADLTEFLGTNSNFNNKEYLIGLIEQSKSLIYANQMLNQTYPRFATVFKYENFYLNCENLYSSLDSDEIFSISQNFYKSNELKTNLIKFCKKFNYIIDEKEYMSLIEAINYSIMKIVRLYKTSNGNYDMIEYILNLNEFLYDFTLISLVIRPISNKVYNNVLNLEISSSQNLFMTSLIVYMIGNALLELYIFIFINKRLIKKVLKINDEIKCLSICLTS